MSKIFNKFFWETLYYDLIWGVRNLKTHFKVVWKSRPWDFNYSPLEMLKFKLEELLVQIENGHEIDETRIEKEKKIKRCIELIKLRLADEYLERVGKPNFEKYPIEFVPFKDGLYELKDRRTPEEIEQDSLLYDKSIDLDDKEWVELWETIKNDARGWWD